MSTSYSPRTPITTPYTLATRPGIINYYTWATVSDTWNTATYTWDNAYSGTPATTWSGRTLI